MSDSTDFNLGRVHGRNGSGWVVKETEAYRQGRIAGSIERQNDLLEKQTQQEQDWRNEQARAQEIEDERRGRAEFEAHRLVADAEEAERTKQEGYRNRALRLVRSLERLAPHANNDSRPFERDAFFFAVRTAEHLSSVDSGVARLLSEAWREGSRVIKRKGEPKMPAEFLQLANQLQELRSQIAQAGLILPFDECFSPDVPAVSDEDRGPGHWAKFYAMRPPSWLENGYGTNLVLTQAWIDIDLDKLNAGLMGLDRSSILPVVLQLRQLAIDADKLGLWEVEPTLLEWLPPLHSSNGLATRDLVNRVFSHRQMLRELATSDDLEAWLDRWVAAPNAQLAAGLDDTNRQAKALEDWVTSDDVAWFNLRPMGAGVSELVRLTRAYRQHHNELSNLDRIAGTMRGREIAEVLARPWDETNAHEGLQQCRQLRKGVDHTHILQAAAGESFRTTDPRWRRVEERFARRFYVLIGPDEALVGQKRLFTAAVLFAVGVLILLLGLVWAGLGLMVLAVFIVKAVWGMRRDGRMEFTEARLRLLKKAGSVAPQMSWMDQLRLWREVNGVHSKAGGSTGAH